MSKSAPTRWAATTLTLALLGAPSPTLALPGAAAIRGLVLADDSRTPLADVQVMVADPTGAVARASRRTTANGAFTLQDLAPGSYRLSIATAAGSYRVETPVRLSPGQTRSVNLALHANAGGSVPPSASTGVTHLTWSSILIGSAVIVGVVLITQGNLDLTSDSKPVSPSAP